MPSTNDDRYEDVLDENGLLKDGKIYRVSFYDSMRAHGFVVDQCALVVDHRPGGPWCPPDRRPVVRDAATMQDARQRLQREYELYDAEARDAWRNPSRGPSTEFAGNGPSFTGHGAPGKGANKIPEGAYPLSAGEGRACTINGAPGTLQRQGDWLVCEPTRTNDVQSLQDARAQAYRRYDEEMANAWRNPR
jgi:hypothetical protein